MEIRQILKDSNRKINVIDNLSSKNSTDALSANQGFILNNAINNLSIPKTATEINYFDEGNALNAANVQDAIVGLNSKLNLLNKDIDDLFANIANSIETTSNSIQTTVG